MMVIAVHDDWLLNAKRKRCFTGGSAKVALGKARRAFVQEGYLPSETRPSLEEFEFWLQGYGYSPCCVGTTWRLNIPVLSPPFV